MNPFESPAILSSKIGFPMFRLISASALVFVCSLAAGCGDDDPPTTPEPPAQINETFQGTINLFGADTHLFTTAVTGQASAVIDALTPDSEIGRASCRERVEICGVQGGGRKDSGNMKN